MLGRLLGWLTGGGLAAIGREIREARAQELRAGTEQAKIEVQERIVELRARQSVLIAEQGRWMTAWIRPAIVFPVVVYVWKLILWDTILGWGVTLNPGEFINWIVITVIAAFFLARPFEGKGRS
ncbi:MAG: hypothetical protein N4A61_16905 [Pelagimonas sp.]|jgi:hypothetical protein|nr:hypothetical protein [Pelagimonas sp.]